MNERIRELAVESGFATGYDRTQTGKWSLSDRELEKFAELIVRECMTICKEHPSRIVSNNWVADAVAPDVVRQFEEHFGVEE